MNEYSRVSIECGEDPGSGALCLVKHESGSIGKVEIGNNLGSALLGIGGRLESHLATALIVVYENKQDLHDWGEEVAAARELFLSGARAVLAAWEKIGGEG